MGHHHKRKSESVQNNTQVPNLMNGLDMSSIASLLNNVDIGQVMSMLSNFNMSPGKKNSTKKQSQNEASNDANPLSGIDPEMISGLLKNVDMNKVSSMLSGMNENHGSDGGSSYENDNKMQVLNYLKSFLPEDKCKLVDDIIKFYGLKKTIDKV